MTQNYQRHSAGIIRDVANTITISSSRINSSINKKARVETQAEPKLTAYEKEIY